MQAGRCAAALLMLACLTALAACMPRSSEGLPRFEARACPSSYRALPATFECGQLLVAETRGDPDSRVLRLFVSIARASGGSMQDPVIFLDGGPGYGPSVSMAYMFDDSWLQDVEDVDAMPPLLPPGRDVIFIDPRGTGRSRPSLDCGPDPWLSRDGALADTFWWLCIRLNRLNGIDLNAYGSAEMAADIADLRSALDLPRVNLWGISHGTRVAMTVLRDHPDGVRSAVLDAPFFPENPGTEDWPWLVEREVKDIFARCRLDADCNREHWHTLQMFERTVAAWIEDGEARIGRRTYQLPDISAYLITALYDPLRTRDLPGHLLDLIEGRDEDLALVTDFDGGAADLQAALVNCSEELPFESAERMREKAGNGAIARLVLSAYVEDDCSDLPLARPDPIENQPVRSEVPILALAAETDPGCPAEYAWSAARFLPNAQVVELFGKTHAVTLVSSCGRQLMASFLDNPTKPVDSSCAQ